LVADNQPFVGLLSLSDTVVGQDRHMERSVTDSWGLITEWLAEHVPAALDCIEPSATQADIAQVSEAMGQELPADFVEWLGLANGMVVRSPIGSMLPTLYVPLSCQGILQRREEFSSAFGGAGPRPEDNDPAGSRALEWLDAFLPFGDSWSDPVLIIDLREGDLHGCIGEFDPEDEGFDAPRWTSTAHMLSDVAAALINRRPAMQDYADGAVWPETRLPAQVPQVEDGRLIWVGVEAT
jgi:cell wall assembly regulator SMI1